LFCSEDLTENDLAIR
jgi:hypothetical protein